MKIFKIILGIFLLIFCILNILLLEYIYCTGDGYQTLFAIISLSIIFSVFLIFVLFMGMELLSGDTKKKSKNKKIKHK